MSSLVVLFLGFVVMLNYEKGVAMEITIHPNKYDGVIPSSFNITCVPKVPPACDNRKMLAIQLSKNGSRPLVTLQHESVISYNRPLLRSSIQAEGRIGNAVGESSTLTVVFSDVLREDSGLYACSAVYFDEWGHMQHESATHNFTVEHQDVQDITRYLMGKLVAMETKLQDQSKQLLDQKMQISRVEDKQMQYIQTDQDVHDSNSHLMGKLVAMETKLQNQEKQLLDQKTQISRVEDKQTQYIQTDQDVHESNSHLMGKLVAMETKLQNQEKQLLDQKMQISGLEDKTTQYIQTDNQTSGFLAGLASSSSVVVNQVLKFSNVLENVGNDYNPKDGVYTAPVTGLYAFHFYGMLYGSGKKYIQVKIQDSDNRELGTSLMEDNDHHDQSSVSCVVKLQPGDKVWCRVAHTPYPTKLLHSFPYTGFTGHLIKAF